MTIIMMQLVEEQLFVACKLAGTLIGQFTKSHERAVLTLAQMHHRVHTK